MIYTTHYQSSIGDLLLACDEKGLCGLWFEQQKYYAASIKGKELQENSSTEILRRTKKWLDQYFGGQRPPLQEITLSLYGSEFQKMIWKLLCEIPYGEVTTYGTLAQKAERLSGHRSSARAVGSAVGHNPVLLLVPCHRVIGANGSLTGYAGGTEKKIALLEIEGINIDGFLKQEKLRRF